MPYLFQGVSIIITMAVTIAVSLSSEEFNVASHVGIQGKILHIVKHMSLLLSVVIG